MKTLLIVMLVLAKITYYHPATCSTAPINCFNPATWWHMAAGTDARDWYGRALACPREFPMGSKWTLPSIRSNGGGIRSQVWTCLDRGGMVTTHLDEYGTITATLDLLYAYPIVSKTIQVEYRWPLPRALLLRAERLRDNCARKRVC